jgi:YidC/Oxa1 family membrane protein insertase
MEQKQPFEGRTLIVIALCILIWWAWQDHLQKKYPAALKPLNSKTETAKAPGTTEGAPAGEQALKSAPAAAPTGSAAIAVPTKPAGEEKKWELNTDHMQVVVSSYGGKISILRLKNYTDRKDQPVTLLSEEVPGFLLTGAEGVPGLENLNYQIKPLGDTAVELTAAAQGLQIKKTLQFVPQDYQIKAKMEFSGNTAAITRVYVDVVQTKPVVGTPTSKMQSMMSLGFVHDMQEYFFNHGTKTSRELVPEEGELRKNYPQTHFAAVGTRYFTTMLYNRSNVLPDGHAIHEGKNSALRLSYPVLDRNSPITVAMDLYAGPKSIPDLKKLDDSASSVIDYGFFSFLAFPMLKLMRWFYGILGNYGFAIIALTLLVRMLTFPFTYVSFKSMKGMQKIQPQLTRLKEIYKDNNQALQQETFKLMREHKVNPMGGCLPIFLQLPVFIALYQVLQNSIELYHAPFGWWIKDLSEKDPFFVLPVLMGIAMFLQQKMTPTTMDPAQAKIMLFMPIMFTFLMLGLPSGLTLYMFVSTMFGIIQQIYMMRDKEPHGQAVVRRA